MLGYYYLCDAGYPNYEGFLAPYKGQRYHLSQWRSGAQLSTPTVFSNMKHSQARNVIDRAFGLLKMRWAILRGPSFYLIKTHCKIISTSCLLHNFVRREMLVDPFEQALEDNDIHSMQDIYEERIIIMETSIEWNAWRGALATRMFTQSQQERRR